MIYRPTRLRDGLFKMSALGLNTSFKTPSPLTNSIIGNQLIKIFPGINDISDLYPQLSSNHDVFRYGSLLYRRSRMSISRAISLSVRLYSALSS